MNRLTKVLSRENRLSQVKNSKKGFTLVELIVVLVIIAILAAIAVPTFLAFMDMGREKQYLTNAEKSLTATQAALSDLYSSASNSFTDTKRAAAKDTAAVGESKFMIWTKDQLIDGMTKALPENIGSYTVDLALYEEEGVIFYYSNGEWEKLSENSWEDAIASLSADSKKAIYMWPYKWDSAFLGGSNQGGSGDEEDEDAIKVVTLKLIPESMDYVFFAREGREYNSGMDSIRVLFWKEGNDKKSTWKQNGTSDIFTAEDGYTYELHVTRHEFQGWTLDGDAFNPTTIAAIQDYVYANLDKGNNFEFTIKLGEFQEITDIEYIYISKSAFTSFTSGNSISNATRCAVADYTKMTVPANAVRIDDDSIEDAYAFAWMENGTMKWWTNAGRAYMPADCSNLFANSQSVSGFNFTGFDFANTTNMHGMFKNAVNLTTVAGLSGSTNLTDVGEMFEGCTSLSSVDISALSTGTLTDAREMFKDCASVSSIDFASDFDTSGVSDFTEMFAGCKNATSINVASFDTSSATTFESMFEECNKVSGLDVSGWDTSHVTALNNTFKNCKAETSLDLSGWNLSKAATLESMFEGDSALTGITVGDSWILTDCTTLEKTFKGCVSLVTLDAGKIVTSRKLVSLKETFAGCRSLDEINLSGFDTGGVKDMASMFSMADSETSALTKVTFSDSVDTVHVMDMSYMFSNCTSLTEIKGIEKFHTANVTNMSYMFAYTNALQSIDLSSFDTSKVTECTGMFYYEDGKSHLETVWASPRFTIGSTGKEMFNNNILVGQRSTSFVDYKDKVEDYKTAKYACVDGWQGKPGYFKAKYREVYISGSALAGMFNEETDAIVKIDSSEYTPSTIMYVEGITPIRDNNHKTDYYAFAWREGNIVYWWTDADVAYLPAECNKLFNATQKGNMKSFDFTGFDVTKVTNMNVMFSGATNLKSVTLGNMFYADNVTTLESMFSTCENLESIDLENFQASFGKVTTLKMMFSGCKALNTSGFGSNFDTSNVVNMTHVFRYCESLENYPFPENADFGSATNFEYIFAGCSSLKSVDFSNKNFRKVENFGYAFNGCTSLESVAYTNADISKAAYFSYSFTNCTSLTSVDFTGCTAPAAVRRVNNMFDGCTSLEEVTMDGWKMSTAEFNNSSCFSNSGVKKLFLTNWEINYVGNNSNNLKGLINSAANLEELSIKGGIIKSSDNSRQFKFLNNNTKLTKVDLSDLEWRNDSLSLEWAFSECIHLEEIDVSGWKIKKLTNTNGSFNGCKALKNIDLSTWDVSQSTNIERLFDGCDVLETIDISGWKLNSITKSDYAFRNCTSLTTIYADNTNTYNSSMLGKTIFVNNNALVGGNGTEFDSTKGTALYARIDTDATPGYFTLKNE